MTKINGNTRSVKIINGTTTTDKEFNVQKCSNPGISYNLHSCDGVRDGKANPFIYEVYAGNNEISKLDLPTDLIDVTKFAANCSDIKAKYTFSGNHVVTVTAGDMNLRFSDKVDVKCNSFLTRSDVANGEKKITSEMIKGITQAVADKAGVATKYTVQQCSHPGIPYYSHECDASKRTAGEHFMYQVHAGNNKIAGFNKDFDLIDVSKFIKNCSELSIDNHKNPTRTEYTAGDAHILFAGNIELECENFLLG
jgi:hypothetical protein